MTEIIKYAEELIRLNGWDRGHIVSRLVAELKAERASEGRKLHEIFHLQDDLKAARAENERLRKLYDSMSNDYERKYEGFG